MMFIFEDMTSIRELYWRYCSVIRVSFRNSFIDRSDAFRRSRDVDIAASEVSCKLFWQFLEYFPTGHVLAPSGKLVRLDDRIWVAPLEHYEPRNGLIDFNSGILRASQEHSDKLLFLGGKCADLISPFEGCPIFLSNDDAELLFEDDLWIVCDETYLVQPNEAFLDEELSRWFDTRASELGITRPDTVEIEYIDGDAERPEKPDDGQEILRSLRKYSNSPLFNSDPTTSESNQKISDYVFQAFPDGKEQATWSTVEARVGYSRRSIVRALKARGEYVGWAQSGQNKT